MNDFFTELKRRNVVRVAIAFVVVSWAVLQFVDIVSPLMGLPEVFQKGILILLVVLFPIALLLSWAYEVTPEGVKKTEEVDKSKSITHGTGQRINKLIIGGLTLAVAFLLYDKFMLTPEQNEEVIPEAEDAQASIAVLPFADLSSEGNQEYFADGLSEEILNVLVGVNDLTVASRTSSFQFKGADLGVPEIAAQLNVTYVLEGSVRKAGDTIRITGQLIEAGTDRHLWSDTFDRELTTENLFAIQDEIASAIVAALRLELNVTDDSLALKSVEVATKNLSAYDKFLRGRNILHGRSKLSDISDSITLFEDVVADDPNFALAWQWLGAGYTVASGWGLHQTIPRDYPELASQAANRALELNPDLAFAYAVRGFSRIIDPGGDFLYAMEQLERGLEFDPNDVTMVHWKGIVLRELGYISEALEWLDKCETLDPAFDNCKEHRARTLTFMGDYQGALDEWNKLSGEFVRVIPFEIYDGFTLAKVGQTYAGRLALSGSFVTEPDFPASSYVKIIQGEVDRFSPEGRRVEAWLDNADKDQMFLYSNQATDLLMFLYLSIGAYDKVNTTEFSKGPGNVKGIWMKDFSEFRKTRQFKEIIRNLNFLPYWKEKGFPPGCRAIGNDDFECGAARDE